MTCDKCKWWRKLFCANICEGMREEFIRIDMEIIARWENEYTKKVN